MISAKMQQINENLTSNPNKSLEPIRVEVEWYSYAMNFSIVLPFLPFQSTFAKSYYEKSLPRWLSVVVHYYVEKLVPPTLCCVWRFSDGLKQNFPAFFVLPGFYAYYKLVSQQNNSIWRWHGPWSLNIQCCGNFSRPFCQTDVVLIFYTEV